MKNIYLTLLFLAITTLSFGQFNATYSATNINGPFGNGEEVEVTWDFSNPYSYYIKTYAKLQLLDGTMPISTVDLGENIIQGFMGGNGIFTFTFGSGCNIPAGDYTLNLIVSFKHNVAFNTPVDIIYNDDGDDNNDDDVFCAPYEIPGSSGDGGICIIPIFSDQNFTGGCCENINLDIVTSNSSQYKPCGIKIEFTASGIPAGTNYTFEWSDGNSSPVRYLLCGEQTYTITVFWTSADGTACSETTTETVRSPCYCAQADPRMLDMAEREEEVKVIQKVEVYPNPSNGRMYLKIADGQNVHQIQVFNTLGQLEQDIRGIFVETQELRLNNTTTGLRYLRLFFTDGRSEIVQVLVQ